MAEAARTSRSGANISEYSVSELSGAIKHALEDGFGYVRLKGEISGFRGPHSSGHCYFSLKDDKARIEAVIWRQSFQRLRFKPEEGMEVLAQGRVTTYPGSSKYQIVIEMLEPAGVGALMALLEDRKKTLAREGLFDQDRKQQLPFWPRVVGIVTSPTGAVIRDMLAGFAERCPTQILLWPVRVQGESCASEVAAAIRGFDAIQPGHSIPRPELLIVARGGGALEDLWGFNEEVVIRATSECRIPIISAIGHETDWTLTDLAADARAPTPTKAAEWSVPKHAELVMKSSELGHRQGLAAARLLDQARAKLRSAVRGLPKKANLLAAPIQQFDALERRLARALIANNQGHAQVLARIAPRLQFRLLVQRVQRSIREVEHLSFRARDGIGRIAAQKRNRIERLFGRLTPRAIGERLDRSNERANVFLRRGQQAVANKIEQRRQALSTFSQLLESLSYQAVLRRGYAVLRDGTGTTIRTVADIRPQLYVSIELHDGQFSAVADGPVPKLDRTIVTSERSTPSTPGVSRKKVSRTHSRSKGQGSLL